VADVERRLPALLQELELSEKAKALPGELSRGMKQKLVIGCGLRTIPARCCSTSRSPDSIRPGSAA